MKVKNGFKYKQNGWNYIHISGGPYERGLAHGTLLKEEIHECLKMMEWNLYDSHGFKIDFFIQVSNFIFKKPLEKISLNSLKKLRESQKVLGLT